MDLSAAKKRKTDENGAAAAAVSPLLLTPDDAAKILAPFTRDQLLSIVVSTLVTSPAVLAAVRAVADADPAQRKLFVRGLGWDTTSDSLRAVFAPFGDIVEAVVIADEATSRCKGFGFVTYRHIDSAVLALKEPSKKIDSRIAFASGSKQGPATDQALRKIYVGNVPTDMPSDRLLAHFATYGEIEEGPIVLGNFALFVYKTVEAAQAALVEPTKTIDGHHVVCKMATKKGKPAPPAPVTGTAELPTGVTHTHAALPGQYGILGSTPSSFPGYPGAFGTFPGALGLNSPMPSFAAGTVGQNSSSTPSSFPGYSGAFGTFLGALGLKSPMPSFAADTVGQNSSLPSSGVGAPSLPSVGSQVPPLGAAGYGAGLGSPYGSSGQYGVPESGGYAGLGLGSSLYRMPPVTGALPSGGYPESGQYPLPSSAYQSQHHQPAGSSPGRRNPAGGVMYPESGQYPLPSSAYQSQHHQPAGSSPGRRYLAGGVMYPESGQYPLPSSAYQSQHHQPAGSFLGRRYPAGGVMYPESGQYPLPSSAYPSQHYQPAGSSPGRRYPAGGVMYPSLPPYY